VGEMTSAKPREGKENLGAQLWRFARILDKLASWEGWTGVRYPNTKAHLPLGCRLHKKTSGAIPVPMAAPKVPSHPMSHSE